MPAVIHARLLAWLCCAIALLTLLGALRLDSHVPSYLLLSALSAAMLGSIFIGRFSWAYAYLAAFLTLGFWFKLSLHTVFAYAYIEPTGWFLGAEPEWTRFYDYVNAGLCGVVLARLGCCLVPQRAPYPVHAAVAPILRAPVALALVALILAIYGFNYVAGFFVTGTAPSLVLPFSLNAPAAFLAFTGVPLLLALVVGRSLRQPSSSVGFAALVILAHGVIASVSTASRAVVVTQTLPLLIGMQSTLAEQGRSISRRIFVATGVALCCALVLVSVLRMFLFLDVGPDLAVAFGYLIQTALLITDRWIGVEGMMVAASSEASMHLFGAVLAESPSAGTQGIYQLLADSPYDDHDSRVFLTLPGIMAVLGLSGSLALIGGGMVAVVLALHLLERLFMLCSGGDKLVLSFVGCALANAAVQMSNFYLLGAFVAQMVVMAGVLGLLTRYGGGRLKSEPCA